MMLWEAACKHVLAAGAAGWLAHMACVDPGPWNITVLGISLAVLATSLAAAAMRRMRHPREPDDKVAGRVLSTVIDGFFAGWVAMVLVVIPLKWFGLDDRALGELIPPEVVGALCAISLVPFLRRKAEGCFDRAFDALLGALVDVLKSWLGRKGSGG
ncbi:hypothetical protein [Lysobacter sp. GCM10012299]|uniref:hypothetical protein n=1 Tax=Lysobacter sp. GCM10012299 TaxID=3317333 RepID=UPI00361EEC78